MSIHTFCPILIKLNVSVRVLHQSYTVLEFQPSPTSGSCDVLRYSCEISHFQSISDTSMATDLEIDYKLIIIIKAPRSPVST